MARYLSKDEVEEARRASSTGVVFGGKYETVAANQPDERAEEWLLTPPAWLGTPTTEWTRRQQAQFPYSESLSIAAAKYFDAWPEQRDALLARDAELTKRLCEKYSYANADEMATAFEALDGRQRFGDDEGDEWYMTSRHYGSVLANAVADGPGSIAGLNFRNLFGSEADFKATPPVTASFRYKSEAEEREGIAEVTLDNYVAVVAGEDVPATSIDDAKTRAALLEMVELGFAFGGEAYQKAYRKFAVAFWKWYKNEPPLISTSPGVLSQRRAKQTFGLFSRIEKAYAENTWEKTSDGLSLVHRTITTQRKKDPIEVLLEPLDSPQWFPPANLAELREKLERIGANDGPFAFAVTMSLAIENDHVDLELDDFIRLIGLEPRSTEQRGEYRTILWECLQLFSQTSGIGPIRGNYRDGNGARIERVEKSPVIAITGTQYPPEMRFDKSETPIAVSFVAGKWFRRHRENRKMLADFGDLRALAVIPGGKAGGAWARRIGLALYQIWRERAHDANIAHVGEEQYKTAQLAKVTRRELFDCVQPNPNPYEILRSGKPGRAREYWTEAIDILRDQKILSSVGSARSEYPRQNWSEAWLDEELDLRPHRQNFIAIEQIQQIAVSAKAFKRKRGRPPKVRPAKQ